MLSGGGSTKDYLKNHYLQYRSADGSSLARQAGKINLFAIFILKGIKLLKEKGIFSFIVPNNILRTTVYDTVRGHILTHSKIDHIVDLKANVFAGVTASTIILNIINIEPNKEHFVNIIDNNINGEISNIVNNKINQTQCLLNPSYVIDLFISDKERQVFQKINDLSVQLSQLLHVRNGIATYKNMAEIYVTPINKQCKPILFGRDIKRYGHSKSKKFVNYVPEKLLRARDEKIFLSDEKLVMQRIGGILVTTLDENQYYTFNSVNNLLLKDNIVYNLKYLLALINSKLLRKYYIMNFSNNSSLTVNISKTFLDVLPIRPIDFSNPSDVELHDQMVSHVERMLDLNKRVNGEGISSQEKKVLQKQIEITDNQIDRLVYKLYDLTDEEIGIVEG